jgi:hypothetical protein
MDHMPGASIDASPIMYVANFMSTFSIICSSLFNSE